MKWGDLDNPPGVTVLSIPEGGKARAEVLRESFEWAKRRNGMRFVAYYSMRRPREVLLRESVLDGRYLIVNDKPAIDV